MWWNFILIVLITAQLIRTDATPDCRFFPCAAKETDFLCTGRIPTKPMGFFTNTQIWQCIGNIGSFVFPYIYIFFHYFNHMILVKVKLDVSGYKRIIFQDCEPHSYLSFLKVILTFLCCEEFVKTLLIRFHSLLVFTNIKNDTFCCLKYRHKIKEFHRSVSSVIQITKL